MSDTLPSIGWVDTALLAIVVISVVVGLWRGLVFELMSLVGWIVAYVLAQAYSPWVGARWSVGGSGTALNQAIAFVSTFIVVLVAWAIIARLVRMLVRATPLTVLDRVLGAVFGALRGVLLLLAVATVVAFTPAARSADWQVSRGAGWLMALLQGLKPILPTEVARHLPV